MEKLKKYELKGVPPKVFIDTKEEIDILNLNFSSLEENFQKLKSKLCNIKKNKIKVDSLTKLRFLLNNFDVMSDNIENIMISLDLDSEWTLTNNDIDRINCNRETNNLFRTFLPYMLTYKIMKDVENGAENKNT